MSVVVPKSKGGSKDWENRLRGRRRREEGGAPQLCASFSIRGKFSLQQCCMYVPTEVSSGRRRKFPHMKNYLFAFFFKKIVPVCETLMRVFMLFFHYCMRGKSHSASY